MNQVNVRGFISPGSLVQVQSSPFIFQRGAKVYATRSTTKTRGKPSWSFSTRGLLSAEWF